MACPQGTVNCPDNMIKQAGQQMMPPPLPANLSSTGYGMPKIKHSGILFGTTKKQ